MKHEAKEKNTNEFHLHVDSNIADLMGGDSIHTYQRLGGVQWKDKFSEQVLSYSCVRERSSVLLLLNNCVLYIAESKCNDFQIFHAKIDKF